MNRESVSNWERGKHEPTSANLVDIARVLGTTVQQLRAGGPGRVSEGGTSAYVARRAPPLPPVAYQRVYEHCRVLAEAGVPEELVEEARRLMSGETFNTLRAGPRDERSDESWLKDVEAAWLFVRDRMHALGFKL